MEQSAAVLVARLATPAPGRASLFHCLQLVANSTEVLDVDNTQNFRATVAVALVADGVAQRPRPTTQDTDSAEVATNTCALRRRRQPSPRSTKVAFLVIPRRWKGRSTSMTAASDSCSVIKRARRFYLFRTTPLQVPPVILIESSQRQPQSHRMCPISACPQA